MNEGQFQTEKASLLAQTAAANKRSEEVKAQMQEFQLDTQLREAYAESGGIGDADDSAAFDAIKHYLEDGRMTFENGQPVFLNL